MALAFLTAHQDSTPNLGYVTGLEDLPSSLRGTQMDGALQADADGRLIIDQHIRLLFDYFLSANGEEPLPQILARIRAYSGFHLPEPAATQAIALLNDYMALLDRMAELERPDLERPNIVPTGNLQSIEEHLSRISDIRKEYLPADVVEAFFGDEETYDRFTLERITIMADDQLTTEQKGRRIADLQTQLPSALQEDLQDSQKIVSLAQSTQHLLNAGGTAEDVHQLRNEQVGEAAADRLAALDGERAEWKAKLDDWLRTRKTVLQDNQLSQPDKAQLLAQLRTARFDDAELRRVRSLERIDDQHP